MTNIKNFKKSMALVLFVVGVFSNSFGLLRAIKTDTGAWSYIPTGIGLACQILLFFIAFIKKNFNLFIKTVVLTTGFLNFLPTLGFDLNTFGIDLIIGTRNPQIFIFYTFLLPVSYGLGIDKPKEVIVPIINLVLLAVCAWSRIDTSVAIIVFVIYIYSLIVTSFFSVSINSYSKRMEQENRKVRKMAERDELTKLYNRHYLQNFEDTNGWIPIMLDIDNFKLVNDTYGHDEGDLVLQQFASILLRYSNNQNFMVFRYGGEEFLIISKLSDQATDERVKDLFEMVRRELHTSDRKPKTVSIGIGKRGALTEESIKEADANLYYCKRNGRNCIAKNGEILYS